VCVNHSSANIPVAEEFLNRADVVSVLEQMGCNGMAERVELRALPAQPYERLFSLPFAKRIRAGDVCSPVTYLYATGLPSFAGFK
jgi:ribosomal protein S28E/S33